MIEGLPLTYDYIKAKYQYLPVKFDVTGKPYSRRKTITVKLNDELYLLEIDRIEGISLLEFGQIRYVIHKFSGHNIMSPHIRFFDDLKMIQVPNGSEDPEEIEFDRCYKLVDGQIWKIEFIK